MKKILVGILITSLIILSVFACKAKINHPIVGKWKIVKATGFMATMNVGTYYTFKSNGELFMKKGILSSTAKYYFKNGELFIKYRSRRRKAIKIIYNLTGDKLKYQMSTSNQIFHMERQ